MADRWGDSQRDRDALDRHITGNYGEDQFADGVEIIVERMEDPDPDPSYLEQEGFEDRLAAYKRGEFSYIGIVAKAEIVVCGTCQTIRSSGLWNIESDMGESYLQEVEREAENELREILEELGGV